MFLRFLCVQILNFDAADFKHSVCRFISCSFHFRYSQSRKGWVGHMTHCCYSRTRDALQHSNERLLKLLSDNVKSAVATEDTINRQLEDLIQETSQVESGLGGGSVEELESATLYLSQVPRDGHMSARFHTLPPGTMTSTPATGLGARPALGTWRTLAFSFSTLPPGKLWWENTFHLKGGTFPLTTNFVRKLRHSNLSLAENRCMIIGHFRVAFHLCFKARPSTTKPFIWKIKISI